MNPQRDIDEPIRDYPRGPAETRDARPPSFGSEPERGSMLASEVSRRVRSILDNVEREAAELRAEAREEARRYLEHAQLAVDEMIAERQRRIGEVSDAILQRSHTVLHRLDEAAPVRQGFDNLVSALGDAAEKLADEIDDLHVSDVSSPPYWGSTRDFEAPAPGGQQSSGSFGPIQGGYDHEAPRYTEVAAPEQAPAHQAQQSPDPSLYQPQPYQPAPDASPAQAAAPIPSAPAQAQEAEEARRPIAFAYGTQGLPYRYEQGEANPAGPPPPLDPPSPPAAATGPTGTNESAPVDEKMDAIRMAAAGKTRSQVESHLIDEHGEQDRTEMLDDLFGQGSADDARVPWTSPPGS